jgi:hypothetical protein
VLTSQTLPDTPAASAPEATMHPTILQQYAEARVADLHREAERRQAVRTARQARAQARPSTSTRLWPAILGRLRSVLTSRAPATPNALPDDPTAEPAPELAQTAAGRPS